MLAEDPDPNSRVSQPGRRVDDTMHLNAEVGEDDQEGSEAIG